MRFGNWQVTTDGIRWKGHALQRFEIDRDNLNATRTRKEDNTELYDWILKATDEDWLTEDDLYDLNYAFVYAAAQYGVAFDYHIFDNTLEQQFALFDEEEDDEVF